MEFAIFRPGLPHNLRRGGGKDSSHQRRDTKIGPGGSCSPDAGRRDHHRHTADRVVARTHPSLCEGKGMRVVLTANQNGNL
jgi:hypothetical protein